MKLEDLVKRADALIAICERATENYKGDYVHPKLFAEITAGGLSFIERAFGRNSIYYGQFLKKGQEDAYDATLKALGILSACRDELAGGWVFTTKGLIAAELFNDFISMAEYLLKEGYKDPAAIMAGSVLEEHLRQLCKKNSIPIEKKKADGSLEPLKADTMNAELAKANVYGKLDLKNITAWLDLRNNAAHGKYGAYDEKQVDLMLQGVSGFISRTPL